VKNIRGFVVPHYCGTPKNDPRGKIEQAKHNMQLVTVVHKLVVWESSFVARSKVRFNG